MTYLIEICLKVLVGMEGQVFKMSRMNIGIWERFIINTIGGRHIGDGDDEIHFCRMMAKLAVAMKSYNMVGVFWVDANSRVIRETEPNIWGLLNN